MNRPARHRQRWGEGGKPSGRAAAFDRWLPFLAGVVGRQGGWAAEALTTRRSRCTKWNRSSAADRPPIRINRAHERQHRFMCAMSNPRRHVHAEAAHAHVAWPCAYVA